MTRREEDARDEIRRDHEALLPAGLVLGHRVVVYRVGVAQAFQGRVVALDPVTIELDRVKHSDAFRAGDRVKALHVGRRAVEATVIEAAHGVLRLEVKKLEGSPRPRVLPSGEEGR